MTSHALARAAGIDVGQRFLDIGLAPSGKTFRVPNVADGIAIIVERLTQEGIGRVVLEAIGPYAQRLVSALAIAGFEVGLINPRRIKAFREFDTMKWEQEVAKVQPVAHTYHLTPVQ